MIQRNNPDAITMVLAKLDDAKKTAKDQWMARCPAHSPDTNPSLSVGIGEGGRVLLNCHAGCLTKDVLAKMGLSKSDLFVSIKSANSRRVVNPRRSTPKPGPRSYPTITAAAAALMPKHRQEKVYRYAPDFSIVRFEPKAFRPFQRVGDEWACGDPPSPLPLFGLNSIKDGEPVLVVEGEKDCETAHMLGFAAVANAHGADSARKTDWSPLAGKNVVIIPDNDDGGLKHTNAVLVELGKLAPAPTVRRLDLPGLKPKGDLTDWVEAHDSRETADLSAMLADLVCEAPVVEVVSDENKTKPTSSQTGGADVGDDGDDSSTKPPSQATRLVELTEDLELFHYQEAGFARLLHDGHVENWPLRSRGFKTWLSREFYLRYVKAPSSQAVSDAITTIEGKALWEGQESEVHIRVGACKETIYLDLCDDKWRAVQIDSDGWRIVESADVPVRFIRRRGMQVLPDPRRGGSIDDLRKFVNLPDDGAWVLFVAWLAAAFRPRGPYPVLVVNGEQGSAKSMLCRLARKIVDPNKVLVRRPPKDERDLVVAATNGHVIALDNLSGLSAGHGRTEAKKLFLTPFLPSFFLPFLPLFFLPRARWVDSRR